MLHLDQLEITPAQTRQSFSLICGSHCPVAHRSHMVRHPDSCHHTGDQLPGGTTRTIVQQPLLGLLPSILSQEGRQEGAKERKHDLLQHTMEATPHQLFGEDQF